MLIQLPCHRLDLEAGYYFFAAGYFFAARSPCAHAINPCTPQGGRSGPEPLFAKPERSEAPPALVSGGLAAPRWAWQPLPVAERWSLYPPQPPHPGIQPLQALLADCSAGLCLEGTGTGCTGSEELPVPQNKTSSHLDCSFHI